MTDTQEISEERKVFNENFNRTLGQLKGMNRQRRRACLRDMEKRKAPKELIDMFKKYLKR